MSVESRSARAIFERSLEIDSDADRQAYLDQRCADDRELRDKVEALLKAHAEAGSFLAVPALDAQQTHHFDPIAERAGTAIGPYKLLEQIGESGFGVVFMAEQERQIKVASNNPAAKSILTVGTLIVGDFLPSSGTLIIQSGGTVNGLSIASLDGLLSLEGGTLRSNFLDVLLPSEFSWTAGTLQVARFGGNLVVPNGGVLVPFRSPTGTTVSGSYNQQAAGAVLAVDISGDSNYGVLAVEDAALLGGSLQVSLTDGFVPSSTDRYDILQSEDIQSSFANVANGQRLMTSDGLGSFIVNYGPGNPLPNHVILSAFAPGGLLPGDYNRDGTVDAADYVVWRNNLGSGTSLPNDDTAGVGPDDYTRWRKKFGQTAAAGHATSNAASILEAVPEPGCMNLYLLAISMLALKRFVSLQFDGEPTRCQPRLNALHCG